MEDYWDLGLVSIDAQLKVAYIVGCSAILPRYMAMVAHPVVIECFATDVATRCISEGSALVSSHYHIYRFSEDLINFRQLSLKTR